MDSIITRNGVDFPIRAFNLDRADDGVVVFLPSVLSPSVKERRAIPYFPRIGWAADYACAIYVADPFQADTFYEIGGSWFLHPERGSVLPDVVRLVRDDLGVGGAPVVYAGSSMGGYAALVLASLDHLACGYSEAPQTRLDQHPDGAAVIRQIERDAPGFTAKHLALCDLTRRDFSGARLVCRVRPSDTHHVTRHVEPLAAALVQTPGAQVSVEDPGDGLTGHQAYSRQSAQEAIKALFAERR